MTRYRIVRIYSDGRRRKTVDIVFSLKTAKKRCTGPASRGRLDGVRWRDIYEKMEE